MTEQSQMPLVGPPKRRGWREIAWFRPLTSSTHAALVVTRRGRLVSILPAGGPRVLSDYLALPYDFREVDTRERLLLLDQRVESFDSSYEFSVSLRLIYQVVRPDRVALELEDVATELAHAVVQSLRFSGRSFGVDQDKTFEEHLQETLITSDALVQRVHLLGLALRRADVTVSLDEATREHAEALRFAMRERPLHFQIAIESLEPDRNFDVIVGGSYRLTDRRTQPGPTDTTDSAIQLAIARTLRRVGITFAPGDYIEASKAMAETLRKDALLQSELSIVQAQLLRPTVQIQPDRSMVHVPRPNLLPDSRPEPVLRRMRQTLPRMGRPPALPDTRDRAPQQAPEARRALPPPAGQWPAPPEQPPAGMAASPTLSLGDLPAPSEPTDGAYTLWPLPEPAPGMRAQHALGQPDDAQDARAPWADLIRGAEDQNDAPWAGMRPDDSSGRFEPLPWEHSATQAADQPQPAFHQWIADQLPAQEQPADAQPWDSLALAATTQPLPDITISEIESDRIEPQPDEPAATWAATPAATEPQAYAQPVSETAELPPEEAALIWTTTVLPIEPQTIQPQQWDAVAADAAEPPAEVSDVAPATFEAGAQPWETVSLDAADAPLAGDPVFDWPATPLAAGPEPIDLHPAEPEPWETLTLDVVELPLAEEPIAAWPTAPLAVEPETWDAARSELATAEPAAADSSPAGDLGFTLDWSDPQAAAPATEPIAETIEPADSSPADALGFTLDWSDPQADRYTDTWTPSVDITTDDRLVAAHWYDPATDLPEPSPSGHTPFMAEPSADDTTAASDLPQPEQTYREDSVAVEQQGEEQDETPALAEQEPSPWYTPTLQLHDHEPLAAAADQPDYETPDALELAWEEAAAAIDPHDHQPPAALSELPYQAPDHEPIVTSEPARDRVPEDTSEPAEAPVEPAPQIPNEQIARIIGMIQSYGPAWFKMWSLELKERPERLPVVLGEVTADPVLLEQAADAHVQSALVAALAAYSAPVMFGGRLPAAAPLPSPAIAGQGHGEADDVPDWLSLRVKWNGHGGGA